MNNFCYLFLLLIMFSFLFCMANIINNRFECFFNRNKSYYNSKSYDEILPNLYIGNIDGAKNLSFLKDKKIKVIINCTKKIPNYYETQFEYYRIPVDDSLLEEDIDLMKGYLSEYVSIIDKSLNSNKPVFVHCYAGRQRSACLIAAYLIFKYKFSINKAYKFIINKRREAFHYGKSYNFHFSLIDYYEKNKFNF